MAEWTQGDVLTNGIRMHYYRTGHGDKPPLVLCHGGSDSGLCWSPVARALEDEYDIIMIDARNHGLSESPRGDSGPQDQSEDLAGLIRALVWSARRSWGTRWAAARRCNWRPIIPSWWGG